MVSDRLGVPVEFDGYGIYGPRYRANFGDGPKIYRYPDF
jgi:hypothetical protein